MHHTDQHVLIVGGGIVGLTAATAMALRGFAVTVIDAGPLSLPVETNNLRAYAINQASQRLLEELGVWQLLEPRALSPYREMYIWDAMNGASIGFDARSIAKPDLGFILAESDLKHALLLRLAAFEQVRLCGGKKVSGVEVSDAEAKVSSAKTHWHGQLLMISDGALSPTRTLLNVPLTTWSYHQHAIVATVKTAKAHQQTAYQVFLNEGPLAFLPLANHHECSIVWSTTPEQAKELMALDDKAFRFTLGNAFDHKLGTITKVGERQSFPLAMRHAKQYVGERWLLMGDAAHTIHPLAGQGLNVGLADIACWLSCLDKAKQKLTAKRALSAYQRERKHAVWQSIVLMEGIKRTFALSFPPWALLRGIGMQCCDELAPLKRLFIAHAAG